VICGHLDVLSFKCLLESTCLLESIQLSIHFRLHVDNKALTNSHIKKSHEYDIFQKIVRLEFTIPEDFDQNCANLIRSLVVTEPSQRLGTQGYDKLKSHVFFETIVWENLSQQQPPA